MELAIIIKTTHETFVRSLKPETNVKWWEGGLYHHLKQRDHWHIGQHKLRNGFSTGDRDFYSLLWRLIMWRMTPANIHPNAMIINVTLDEEFEQCLNKDLADAQEEWNAYEKGEVNIYNIADVVDKMDSMDICE